MRATPILMAGGLLLFSAASACRDPVGAGPGATALPAGASASPAAAEITAPSASIGHLLDPQRLMLQSKTETDARVRAVFPNGIASEDARAEVGTAPAPPASDAPDGTQSFVSEIVPSHPASAEQARAAMPPSDAKQIERWVLGLASGSAAWIHVADHEAAGKSFSRIAVVVDLVSNDAAVDAARLAREVKWASAFAAKLGAPQPKPSMTPEQAVAKAKAAIEARKTYPDEDVDVGVAIVARKGRRFAGRKVWDAVYSAGFSWGDGDYFHWVPSPATDVSQGIGMGTTTGSSYFLPESLAANDGRGDVDDLEMSFNAARSWEPTKLFEVMTHAAAYLARRLDGTVVDKQGRPFDVGAVRARVVAIDRGLRARGVTPGSPLALLVF